MIRHMQQTPSICALSVGRWGLLLFTTPWVLVCISPTVLSPLISSRAMHGELSLERGGQESNLHVHGSAEKYIALKRMLRSRRP